MAHVFRRGRAAGREKSANPPSPLSNSKQVSKYLAGAASGFVSCRPGFYYVLPLVRALVGGVSDGHGWSAIDTHTGTTAMPTTNHHARGAQHRWRRHTHHTHTHALECSASVAPAQQ
jgi:hypothetical protein